MKFFLKNSASIHFYNEFCFQLNQILFSPQPISLIEVIIYRKTMSLFKFQFDNLLSMIFEKAI